MGFGSGIRRYPEKTYRYPGSQIQGQKGTGSRIRIRNTVTVVPSSLPVVGTLSMDTTDSVLLPSLKECSFFVWQNSFPKLYELHTILLHHNNITDIYRSVFTSLFSLRSTNFLRHPLCAVSVSFPASKQ
jgi:hypothetical protein